MPIFLHDLSLYYYTPVMPVSPNVDRDVRGPLADSIGRGIAITTVDTIVGSTPPDSLAEKQNVEN